MGGVGGVGREKGEILCEKQPSETESFTPDLSDFLPEGMSIKYA